MLTIIKLLLFFISTFGSWELLRRKCNVNVYFVPSLTIAIQTTILFLGGLLNLLPEFATIIYLIGLFGVAYSFWKDKSFAFLKLYCCPAFFLFAILLVVFLVFVKGKLFWDYDNFSHWAIVIKIMLQTERYPNFRDVLVMFQEYPLGSSTYIYYVAKMVSSSESVQMIAQVYMMLTCFMPIFAISSKNKIATIVVVLSAINFVFLYNIVITSLLVDTLLPLVGMAGLFYAYLYCKKESMPGEILMASFYMIQLVQIKHSGMFFVVLICIWIMVNAQKNKYLVPRIICVLLPFISFILWHKHCKYAFYGAETTKHSMTIKYITNIFQQKSIEDIRLICINMLKFTFTYKDVWLVVAFIALLGIIILFLTKDEKHNYKKLVMISVGIYFTYQIGMLGTYLFSMPLGEALCLAGNTRYTRTILIAIIYMILILIVKVLSRLSERKVSTIIVSTVMFFSFFAYMFFANGYVKTALQDPGDNSLRVWIEETRRAYNIPNGESYCILVDEKTDYAFFMGRFVFETDNITSFVVYNTDQMDSISSKYIFVYDTDNEMIKEWIRENCPEQLGESVIIREY